MSRLQITGKLDEYVPIVVLLEMANSHGIAASYSQLRRKSKRLKLIKYLNSVKPINSKDCSVLARFINHEVDWNKQALHRSYSFMSKFMNTQNTEITFKYSEIMSLEAGSQIPKRPRRLNACMLYRLCRDRSLNPRLEITTEGMKLLIELSNYSTGALRKVVDPKLRFPGDYSRHQMMRIIENLTETRLKNRLRFTRSDLETVDKNAIIPRNRIEAVYLSFNLGVDVTDTDSPIQEYYILRDNVDRYLRGKSSKCRCPELESMNVKVRYNPLIPFDWYSYESVQNFIKLTGYDYHLVPNPEEIVQLGYLTENFYKGLAPKITNVETPVTLEEVSTLAWSESLSYGIVGNPMVAITIMELQDMFRANGNFSRPDGGYYSEAAVNKLQMLDESLAIVISEVKEFQCVDEINDLHNHDQSSVIDCLTELLQLAMYMRGWDGKSRYPIGSSPVKDYEVLMKNVSRQLLAFMNKIEDPVWAYVLSLPMRLYKSGKFLKTQNCETIISRLKTVRSGNGVQACIRISSNWLASSSYFYQRCLDHTPDGFGANEVANMRHIA